MGLGGQLATNANQYLNIRLTGGFYQYADNAIHLKGMDVVATAKMAAVGAVLDVFPWPAHGFHISPGVLLYNRNHVDAKIYASPGTGFTFNDVTFYSSQKNPVQGVGSVNLHKQVPAFTIGAGWGNIIPRNVGHWSFPVDVGVAMIGQPEPSMTITSGQICANPQGTIGCRNAATDPSLQSNLQAQMVKYRNDLEPLRFYPVLSWGITYNFPIR